MVPGFFHSDRPVGHDAATRSSAPVALAGPWDFDNGSGRHVKICGDAYTNTSCAGLVLLCKNCRQCRWLDVAGGFFEDCQTSYPCGVCVGVSSPDDW
jgi:hypothetical protein